MKNSRFQFQYRESASKLHKKVGDILRNSTLIGGHHVYQEYPVNRVNPNYPASSHHFDWVIPSLKLVFECHGKQHYEVCSFGAEAEKAIENFKAQQERDKAKKIAALSAGYCYVEVPYTLEKSLSEMVLFDLLLKASAETGVLPSSGKVEDKKFPDRKQEVKDRARDKRQAYLQSDKHQEELDRAREYRKAQYQKMKERQ